MGEAGAAGDLAQRRPNLAVGPLNQVRPPYRARVLSTRIVRITPSLVA